MVEIYAVKVEDSRNDREYERCLSHVSLHKKQKIEKYRHKDVALRSLYGEILAQAAIRKKYHIKDREIEFQYSEHGKPYLAGMEHIYFNVSHSGDWVVCAIGEQEIGVDIEQIKSGRGKRIKVAKRFFTTHEYEYIMKQPEEMQEEIFYRLWTLKECYLKWSGKGLTVPLDSFEFQIEKDTIQLISSDNKELKFRQYKMDKNYIAAVCSTEELSVDSLTIIDVEQLNEWMDKGE